jgi:Trm5-related predicted tRNA methylase
MFPKNLEPLTDKALRNNVAQAMASEYVKERNIPGNLKDVVHEKKRRSYLGRYDELGIETLLVDLELTERSSVREQMFSLRGRAATKPRFRYVSKTTLNLTEKGIEYVPQDALLRPNHQKT